MRLVGLLELRATQVVSQGAITYFKGDYSESVNIEIART